MADDNLVDFGSMSDEDFLSMAPPGADKVPFHNLEEDSNEPEQEDNNTEEASSDNSYEDFEEFEDFEDEEDDEVQEESDDAEEEPELVDEDDNQDPFDGESQELEEEAEPEEAKSDSEVLKAALAPFKANGKEIKVDNIEDLRRLAQMGAGYNAKMQELKPIRKIAQTLKKAGLLDEQKINHLIDLSKGNKGAINRLVKESGINPLDIDTEDDDYTPNTYTVSDNQFALDEALDELERTSSGQRTIEIISTKMDAKSKQRLVNDMDGIYMLQSQIENGMYDQIMNAVEVERMLGRISPSTPDLDAYNQVGQQLAQAGAFKRNEAKAPEATKAPDRKKATPKSDTKRKTKRKAAASPRKRKPAKASPDSFLEMSDEEFMKQFG